MFTQLITLIHYLPCIKLYQELWAHNSLCMSSQWYTTFVHWYRCGCRAAKVAEACEVTTRGQKSLIWPIPLSFDALIHGVLLRIYVYLVPFQKVDTCPGYDMVKTKPLCDRCSQFFMIHECDTGGIAVANSALCVLRIRHVLKIQRLLHCWYKTVAYNHTMESLRFGVEESAVGNLHYYK